MQSFICRNATGENLVFANSRKEAAMIAGCNIKNVQLNTRKH